jgi:RHS repeat-associated protein
MSASQSKRARDARLSLTSALALLAVATAILVPTAHSATPAPASAALTKLSDDTAARLRQALTPTVSTARLGLQQALDALATDAGPARSVLKLRPDQQALQTGDADASASASASALNGTRAAAHRAQLRALRQQVLREVADLRQQVRDAGHAASDEALDQLVREAEQRFDRLDRALARLEGLASGDAAGLASAQQALVALLAELRPVRSAQPAMPVPTRRAREPIAPLPKTVQAQASDALPRYALDLLRDRHAATRDAQQVGFVKVAASLPPVAAQAPADCSSTAADLADDGAEVQLSRQILALAQTLDYSPTRILAWMQHEVRFEPYWGSLKGSVGVLESRSGNATDQSSLLIALLRASNIPARFVLGNVALVDQQPSNSEVGRAQRWLGTKNYAASAAYLSNGFGVGSLTAGGVVQGLSFSHVWVEACLPYASYRGKLADSAGMRWIAVDASIKDHDYQAGLAVNVPLDSGFYDTYLATLRDDLPTQYFADKVEQAARGQRTDASVDDVPYRGTPRTLRFDVVPSATAFRVQSFKNWPGTSSPESATIPDTHRHKFQVDVLNAAGSVLLSSVSSFPQHVLSRLTVSYQPDAASQALWDRWGGSMAGLPTGVKVYPQIKRDGLAVASGNGALPMALGEVHTLVMKLTQGETSNGKCIDSSGDPGAAPDSDKTCLNKTVYKNVRAGAYYALGVNANQGSDARLDVLAKTLSDGVAVNASAPTPASGSAYDATVGALLQLVLQTYIHDISAADQRIADLAGFKSTGFYDIGLTGSELQTDFLFDLPLVVKPSGVYVDFKGGQYGFTKIDTSANLIEAADLWRATLRADQRDLAKLSGYAASALEHHVWQQALRTDAVSTIRGLQYAVSQGIALVKLDASNIANFDALMQVSGPTSMAGYKAAISAEVGAGATVTVPRAQIAYADPVSSGVAWRGAVYMTENPTTGAYGAIITGGLSGGYPLLNSTPVGSLYQLPSTTPSFQSLASAEASFVLQATAPGRQGSNGLAAMAFDPVNMLTGNLVHNETDLSIKGRGGLPIVLERWYNSGTPKDGPMGFGWTHSFNHALRLYGVEAGQAKVGWVNGSGGETYFSTTAHSSGDINRGATFVNPTGTTVQFTRVAGGADDGRFRIRERNGLSYLFASATGPGTAPAASGAVQAQLVSITDRNGNRLSLGYNGSGQLATVSDSLGRTVLTFTWNGTAAGSHISQVVDLVGRTVRYSYDDGRANLTQVDDALGRAHGYSYFSVADGKALDHHVKRMTRARGNGIAFEYYSGGQVFRHTPFDLDGTAIGASAVSFHYNFYGRESWTVNARGHEQHFNFDALGNTVRTTQPGGGIYSYIYDSAKPYNRLSETDPVGRTTRYTYTPEDLVDTVTLPSGAAVQYRDYNAFAQPQRIKDARGNWTWLQYDGSGNLTNTVQLRSGAVPVAGTQPAAADIRAWLRRSYDAVGNVVTTTRIKDFAAATGPSQTQNWSTDRLNVLSVLRTGNRSGSTVSETSPSLGYDSLNRLKSGIDARWYPSSTDYDMLDRVTSITDELGKTRKSQFDANGNLVLVETLDASGRLDSRATTFDGLDRATSILDHAGARTAMGYDAAGNLIWRTSPDNYTTSFEFDENDRPVAAFDQEGNAIRSQRDALGRPVAVIDPNGNTTRYRYWGASTYDGRLRSTTAPAAAGQAAGRSVETDYDEAGQAIRRRLVAGDGTTTRQTYAYYDELGRQVRSLGLPDDAGLRLQTCQRFDNLGHVTEVWAGPSSDTTTAVCNFADGSLKRQASFEWDDYSQLLSRTDALGQRWAFSWDLHGNLATSQTPEQARLSQRTVYDYDPALNGLLAQRTAPGSGVVSYVRDALGQVRQVTTDDDSGRNVVRYSYDYDVAHRLRSIRDSRGPTTLWYEWTPGGRLGAVSLTDGVGAITHRWDYRYDATGRLAAVLAPSGQATSFAYDAGGRLLSQVAGDAAAGGTVSSYSWLADDSLQAISHSILGAGGNAVVASHSYGYNVWGQRSSATEVVGGGSRSLSWAYDAAGRLNFAGNGTAAQDERYSFDVFGNRISRSLGSPASQSWTATHDDAHQLLQLQQSLGGASGGSDVSLRAVYDSAGQLTRLCEGAAVSGNASSCTGSRISSLQWDTQGQLLALSKTGDQSLSETYAYDDQGRRLRKTSAGVGTAFVYQGDALLAEWPTTGLASGPAAVYVQAGSDQPVLRLSGASGTPDAAPQVLLADGLGSVRTAIGPPVNVALASNGATASASSAGDSLFPPGAAINGDRTGRGWAATTCCWSDSTPDVYPDWLQVSFAGTRTIDTIDVFGVQDDIVNPVEPTPAMTWSTFYGLIDFDVQYWDAASGRWLTVPGGSVRGNNKVWRRISFAPIATDRIRVLVSNGATGYSRIVEIQAWTAPTHSQSFDAWGQKTASTGDAIPRFGYIGREPDATGLNYHRARYYHPGLGRFISRDPLGLAAGINPYAYADGDPVNNADPSGLLANSVSNAVVGYTGKAMDAVGSFASGLSLTGTLDQFGRKLAADFVNNNSPLPGTNGGFGGAQGLLAGQLSNFASGYDGSGSNGQVAAAMAVGASLLTPAGAEGKVAAEASAVVRGGETAAAAYGRQAHQAYENTLGGLGSNPNVLINRSIPNSTSGLRPDVIDFDNKVVRELKPDSASGIRAGLRQLKSYVSELERVTGEAWQGVLDLYSRPKKP